MKNNTGKFYCTIGAPHPEQQPYGDVFDVQEVVTAHEVMWGEYENFIDYRINGVPASLMLLSSSNGVFLQENLVGIDRPAF